MGRPAKPEGTRIGDITPTGVRLEPGLREALARQAAINGRSLNQEIVIRLRDSVAGDRRPHAPRVGAAEPAPATAPQLSDAQRMLLTRFGKLTPDKQLALLQLLQP